ncbi:MAG: hypothetical protein A3J74_00055 [Elusimicrobia bacterium RIFCSPHIGHO2_02_FULL_57_9]|nr:MAG: hypothetical protein A3J74_00055 [Elusimicrobia bacterium RIFCSPHIGHO2_02_FULL_57_9]
MFTKGRQKTSSENAPAFRQQGPADAKIVIVEFSDFQCPACKAAGPPIERILALYGKDIRFIFKHFPLEGVHPWARTTAIATECAGERGRFWPLHDKLYEKQEEWSQAADPKAELVKYAGQLGLDEQPFTACLADPETRAAVDSDIKEGRDRWVGSTPTFFINGRRFAGSLQLSSRGMIWIEKLLKE